MTVYFGREAERGPCFTVEFWYKRVENAIETDQDFNSSAVT
jgi:hypothetical protein